MRVTNVESLQHNETIHIIMDVDHKREGVFGGVRILVNDTMRAAREVHPGVRPCLQAQDGECVLELR